MEWILIVFTTAQWHSSSFSEGGYKSEEACATAAPAIVSRMTDWEHGKQLAMTSAQSKLYNARKWEWVCAPSGKK